MMKRKSHFCCCVIIGALITGCATPKVVTVPEYHTLERHTTDTVRMTDSIHERKVTIVRELDSAAMLQYGIRLDGLQRAWLVETQRIQREVERLRETHTDTVCRVDSVPYPVQVPVEVEAKLTRWQTVRMSVGDVALLFLGVGILGGCFFVYRKFSP